LALNLSKRTILLLAQAWSGTLRGLKNFADLNGIDWEDVLYERDPTSTSVEAHAQALVNVALRNDKWFKAYLDELGYREVFDLLGEINKDLEKDKLTLMDIDDEWELLDISKTKTSTINVDDYKKNDDQTNTKKVEPKPDLKKWDVFISHASEDKESVAKPFAEKLQKLNLNVWYDEFSLKWGKSLRKSIDEGLSNSLFGIVVLSKTFFQKTWTRIELDGLTTIMTTTGKDNILPLRYEISHDEVAEVSPTLAGIFSRSWDEGIDKLANEVKELVEAQKLVKSKQKTQSEPSYATTSVSKSKFTGLFDPKYVGRACGRCGRRVKEEHYITDGKCSFCGYDLDGDRLTFGM